MAGPRTLPNMSVQLFAKMDSTAEACGVGVSGCHIWLHGTPSTVAHQAPLSMGLLGKSTGVGCHSLLQGISPTQGSNPGLRHCRCTLHCLSLQGSPVGYGVVPPPFLTPKEPSCASTAREALLDPSSDHLTSLLQQTLASATSFVLRTEGSKALILLHLTNASCLSQGSI